MADLVEFLERVLASSVQSEGLTYVPQVAAGDGDLEGAEHQLGRALSPSHKRILARWNGLNLDVLRLYGVGATAREKGISSITETTFAEVPEGWIVIGSDPAGFVYVEKPNGEIWSWDHDGGATSRIARDLEDFLVRVVFGVDASEFGGEEWAEELRAAGLI